MVKPEWGAKRTCTSCGEHFYDLNRKPIKCPKCGNEMDLEELLKHRSAATAKAARKANKTKMAAMVDSELSSIDEDLIGEDVFDDEAVDDEDEIDDLIEDASDLGDDNHDVAEVIDNIEKGDNE